MKRLINVYLLSFCFIFAACKIDNYPAPDGSIYGTLVDKVTSEPLESEQPNGFVIRLFEKGKSKNSPISFTGKPDGSFENAMVFQHEYQVIPVEGAFFPVSDTTVVDVKGRTEVKFSVMPFLVVTNIGVKTETGKIVASYRIARERIGDKIVERKLLVSKIPTVNNVVFDFKKETNLADVDDGDVLKGQFTDEISGLAAGSYYVRVATRTNNALRKYNYSKPFKVTVP